MPKKDKIIDPFTNIEYKPVQSAAEAESSAGQGGTFLSQLRELSVGQGGSNVFRADSSGFWAGGRTFASAPFSVSMAGALTTSSILITGGTMRYGKTSFTDNAHSGYYFGTEGLYAGKIADATLFKFNIGTGAFEYTGKAIVDPVGSDLPAAAITGSITAGQITSLTAGQITGSITAGQIGSVNATAITGTITSDQIGSVAATTITGSITAGQITSLDATQITGSITSSQIGSVAATTITGSITSGQISSVAATTITGSIVAGQIGSINASVINGVIVTSQLADQIIDTLSLFATDLRPISQVNTLPTLPDTAYPEGATVYLTTDQKLYRNAAGSWSASAAASDITGTLTASQIGSVNSSAITGLILAGQINTIAATQITGSIQAGQIASITAGQITGSITSSQIGSVAASTITGSITSGQITSITVGQLTGQISGTQIADLAVSAGKIANLTITAGQIKNLTVTGGKLANNTVTYDKINVSYLSAISANIGTITAGTFRVSARMNIQKSTGVPIGYLGQDPNATNIWGVIVEYGYGFMCRYSWSNYGRIYVSGTDFIFDMPSPNKIKIQDNEGNAIGRWYGRNAGFSGVGGLDLMGPMRLYTSSTPPTGASNGMMFYHTTWDEVWSYQNGAWHALADKDWVTDNFVHQ